jgi:hypothetical protein
MLAASPPRALDFLSSLSVVKKKKQILTICVHSHANRWHKLAPYKSGQCNFVRLTAVLKRVLDTNMSYSIGVTILSSVTEKVWVSVGGKWTKVRNWVPLAYFLVRQGTFSRNYTRGLGLNYFSESLGLLASSVVWNSKLIEKHNVSETKYVSVFRWEEGDRNNQLDSVIKLS